MKRDDWRRAYEPLPDSLDSRVSYTLSQIGEDVKVKKFTIRTAAIAMAILLALCGVAYAIYESVTADLFGWFYGEERKQELLQGDIAPVGQSRQLGDVVYTVEEMVYKTIGDFPGLYGVLRVKPAEGSNVTLIAEDYSVNDAAGYLIYFGEDEQIPEDAPSYAELAAQRGGKIVLGRASMESVLIDGEPAQADIGYSWLPQKDGTLLGIFEVASDDVKRSDSYEVNFHLSNWEITPDGTWLRDEPNSTWLKEDWAIDVKPTMMGVEPDATPAPVAEETEAPVYASGEALRVIDSWRAAESYQKLYPDRAIEAIKPEFDDNGVFNLRELLMSGDWDAAWVDTDSIALKELYDAGLVMELDDMEKLKQYAEELYPAFKSGLSIDGKLVALPSHMWSIGPQFEFTSVVQSSLDEPGYDVRAQLGFTDADVPKTFVELCGLAERYMALPKETRKGTIFNFDSGSVNAKTYFLWSLIDLYAAEYCDDNGNVSFDTPEFRECLAALDDMVAALNTDPKKSYTEDGSMYSLVNVLSSSFGEDDALQLRITEGSGISASLEVLVINPNSKHISEAQDYLTVALDDSLVEFGYMFYESIDYEALRIRAYDEMIEAQRKQNEAQSVIDKLISLRDSGDTSYYMDKAEIERYRERVAPYLRFPLRPRIDAWTTAEKSVRDKLDADGIIKLLNKGK